MGRPRIHDHETRERLLRAAERMVVEGGVESLSVRQLADATGTTTRAIYSVFGNKYGVVRALYREAMVVIEHGIAGQPLTDDPIEDLVKTGKSVFRRFSLDTPNTFRLVFEGRVEREVLTPEDLAVGWTTFRKLQSRVQRIADAGLLDASAVGTVTIQFHALCQGLASNELIGRLAMFGDPPQVWDDALRALLRGMGLISTATRPVEAPSPSRRSRSRARR